MSRMPSLDSLERGRRPHIVALVTTAALAAGTPVRFTILVTHMDPAQYAYLSIFNTLTSLMPYIVSAGLPLQFQYAAARHGPGAVTHLRREGLRLAGISMVPSLAICTFMAAAFPAAGPILVVVLATVVTSVCAALTILLAQVLLGLDRRVSSTLALFGYNVLLTVFVLPFALARGGIRASDVLIAWTGASMLGLALAFMLMRFATDGPSVVVPATRMIHVAAGLGTIPVFVGPWLLLIIVKYSLGALGAEEALASFTISWTLTDLAYLAAVNIPTLASTRLMLGRQRAGAVLLTSIVVLVSATVGGYVVVEAFLGRFAQEYVIALPTTVVLALVGAARLGIATWLPLAVARGTETRASWPYIGAAFALAIACAVVRPSSAVASAVFLLVAFGFVALAGYHLGTNGKSIAAAVTAKAGGRW